MKNDDLSYVSLLAKGSVINDQYLSVPSHLKISGIVTKNIECGGKLVIDSTGVVEGNVKAKDLVLHGKFEGNIWVQNTLSICRSAEITGYISADKLRVEEGAYCVMDADIDGQAKKRHDRSDIGVNSGKTRGKSGKKIPPARLNGSKKNKVKPGNTPSATSGDLPDTREDIDRFW